MQQFDCYVSTRLKVRLVSHYKTVELGSLNARYPYTAAAQISACF